MSDRLHLPVRAPNEPLNVKAVSELPLFIDFAQVERQQRIDADRKTVQIKSFRHLTW